MSVKYKLVLKKDLTKGAAIDAKRYYASANVTGMMDFDTICDVVADRSTASDGDVALVLLGLIRCMQEALLRGEVVQLGALGNFRLSLGSSGVVNADDFHASLIRKPRIIYSPGVKLREMIAKVSIERIGQETDKSNAGGEENYETSANQLRKRMPTGSCVGRSRLQPESAGHSGTGGV